MSVVRREQIRGLNQNRTPASASALRTTFGRWICANCRARCIPARASASRTRSARGICARCREGVANMIKQVRPKLSLLLLTYHRIYINAAVGERSQSAAQTAAESSNIHPSIYSKTYTEGSDPFVPFIIP